jgi:hypothetical protein
MAVRESPLTIWTVSDGRIGIERQAVSLAMSVSDLEIARGNPQPIVRSLRLHPTGWRLALPPHYWPSALRALNPEERGELAPPWPDLWIASGRRSIAYSRYARSVSRAPFIVQTQDPRGPLAPFDLVVPPAHDGLRGPNVFPILGSPTRFSLPDVEEAAARFPQLLTDQGPRLLLSIGGDSKTHRLTPRIAMGIEAGVRRLAALGATLWITVSRRTPQGATDALRTLARDVGARFWENENRDGPNPYIAFLAFCDAALITEDSANLLSDAAYFAKPIHLIRLEGGSRRFQRLHEGFIAHGAARWFQGSVSHWSYPRLRESERVAQEILSRLDRRLASAS